MTEFRYFFELNFKFNTGIYLLPASNFVLLEINKFGANINFMLPFLVFLTTVN